MYMAVKRALSRDKTSAKINALRFGEGRFFAESKFEPPGDLGPTKQFAMT